MTIGKVQRKLSLLFSCAKVSFVVVFLLNSSSDFLVIGILVFSDPSLEILFLNSVITFMTEPQSFYFY